MKKNVFKSLYQYLIDIGMLKWISDEKYIKHIYKKRLNKDLNLDNPVTFNEKIQWLKLYDRKEIYSTMVDKYEVKKYVANAIGKKYIVPTLGVWDKFDDIDFDKLPDKFVLKCTHDSGGLYICRSKKDIDIKKIRRRFNLIMKRNFYYRSREWAYKNVEPRIIAEELLEDKKHLVPEDYKIYCMNGEPKYIVVFHNRFNKDSQLSETVYDTNWRRQNFSIDEHFAISNEIEPKPKCLDELLRICKILCKDTYQSR